MFQRFEFDTQGRHLDEMKVWKSAALVFSAGRLE